MSEKCCCGGSTERPNMDCERCVLIADATRLTAELAAANHQLDQIANAQRNALTTECLEGVWWAKGSGILAGPQATEREALLEVAANWWQSVNCITPNPGVAMSESDTLALQCVGRILKPARLMAGKGMRQFAQEIGLLPSRISEIETGSAPTAAELKLMADALEAARREGIDWRESTVATLAARESELAEANERALKYKNYTHARMDKLGAPHEVPDSEHTKAGCRIGGRFDWVERRVAELEAERELLRKALAMNTANLLRDRIDRYKMTLNQIARSGGSRDFFMEEQVEKMEKELAALLPPDRITHIPGKEDHDGEMH